MAKASRLDLPQGVLVLSNECLRKQATREFASRFPHGYEFIELYSREHVTGVGDYALGSFLVGRI